MAALFRGKDPREPAKVLAMVLAKDAAMPGPEAVRLLLAKTRKVQIDHAGATLGAFDVEGEPSLIGLVPAPIPWSQLAGPCATAWWWPEATAVSHRSPRWQRSGDVLFLEWPA
jgi:hypothetical protein